MSNIKRSQPETLDATTHADPFYYPGEEPATVNYTETSADRLMAALESEEAMQAFRSMEIERALCDATNGQIIDEYERRMNPF